MTPQKQTIFGPQKGNCFAACIAALCDLRVDDVPNFASFEGEWYSRTMNWLKEHGFGALYLENENVKYWPHNSYYIATGPSPRGDFFHSVLYFEEKPFFDPHPDDTFLAGDPEYFIWIFRQ